MTDPHATDVPLRIGMLSTANIGRHFAAGCRGSAKVEVVAVGGRDAAKTAEFARKNDIPRAVDGYAALLADPDIDAIYNPLPNTMHAEWSIRALAAGKHVLCEKPIAVTAEEARTMFAAAERAGLLLREAFPYRSQPQTRALAKLVAGGEIGRPRIVQAAFGFPVANSANIRLNPELGGGSLLDAGSYPVSLVRMLAGEQPSRVTAAATWAASGVDMMLAATFEFPSGLLAQAASSFGTGLYRRAMVACENGTVETDFLNHLSVDQPGEMRVSRGGWTPTRETMDFAPLDGFRAEAESFADAVRVGLDAWTGIGASESIDVMAMLDATIESARSGRPVAL